MVMELHLSAEILQYDGYMLNSADPSKGSQQILKWERKLCNMYNQVVSVI